MKTLGWGLFCACSWTWCIGMFLPLVMVDRWGWAGFAAFAVPNVIGCAVFGYMLRNRQRAAQMVVEHRAAMRLFSIVTLAYHVFFIGFLAWVAPLTPFEYWDGIRLAIVAPVAFLAISALLARLPAGAWLPFAAVIYAVSLATFASLGVAPLTEVPAVAGDLFATHRGLVWIVPALAFGFLLCPYLDLTFHRALASSPSRHSFALFGATFSVMIVLSVAYADALIEGLSWIVLAHITAQTIFTMAAHQRELLATAPSDDRGTIGRGTARVAAALAPLLALPLAFAGLFHDSPLEGSIEIYLRFLVFYGLLFPGYVALYMGPRPVLSPRRNHLAPAALIALPGAAFYELAFIHDLAALAVFPPLAVVLLVVRRSRRSPST